MEIILKKEIQSDPDLMPEVESLVLDAATKAVLDKGKRNVEILKQPQYSPVPVEKQIAIIYCGTKGLLKQVPVDKVQQFEEDFLAQMELKHQKTLDTLKAGKLTDEVVATIESLAMEIAGKYKPS